MPTAPTPSQTVCQVAVALIPVRIFAGALIGRSAERSAGARRSPRAGTRTSPRDPSPDWASRAVGTFERWRIAIEARRWLSGRLPGWLKAIIHRVTSKLIAVGIVLVILVAIVAELFAIKGTFDIRPNVFEIRWVAGSLALGTMAAGLSTCVPWAERVFAEDIWRHRLYGAVSPMRSRRCWGRCRSGRAWRPVSAKR